MYLRVQVLSGSAMLVVPNSRAWPANFVVVGSSVQSSASPGETVNSVSINPEKGQRGVIALAYLDPDIGWQSALVPIRWEGDKLIVGNPGGDHVVNFFNPERTGQLRFDSKDHSPFLDIQIGGRHFSSSATQKGPETYFVSDPDLLCKYLVGDVDADVLEAAAVKTKADLDLIDKLKADLVETQRALAGARRQIQESEAHASAVDKSLREEVSQVTILAGKLAKILKGKWFKGKETKKLLTDPRLSWVK